jgi:hypothetical protein
LPLDPFSNTFCPFPYLAKLGVIPGWPARGSRQKKCPRLLHAGVDCRFQTRIPCAPKRWKQRPEF